MSADRLSGHMYPFRCAAKAQRRSTPTYSRTTDYALSSSRRFLSKTRNPTHRPAAFAAGRARAPHSDNGGPRGTRSWRTAEQTIRRVRRMGANPSRRSGSSVPHWVRGVPKGPRTGTLWPDGVTGQRGAAPWFKSPDAVCGKTKTVGDKSARDRYPPRAQISAVRRKLRVRSA